MTMEASALHQQQQDRKQQPRAWRGTPQPVVKDLRLSHAKTSVVTVGVCRRGLQAIGCLLEGYWWSYDWTVMLR